MTDDLTSLLVALLQLRSAVSPDEAADMWREIAASRGMLTLLQREGASLWMFRRLHDLAVPAGDVALRQAAHSALMSGLRIDAELRAVSTILEGDGIPHSPIKGPARRAAAAWYPYADARSTADVDLLLPADVIQAAWDTLVHHGYRPVREDAPSTDHFHLPPLAGTAGVAVELHSSTMPWLAPADAWRRHTDGGDLISWEGQEYTISNATELLWHGMAHAFIDGAEGFRLRTFLDGAVVIGSGRAIAWPVILDRIAAGEIIEAERGVPVAPVMLHRWLATAGMLAGTELPTAVGSHGPLPLTRLLRWKLLVLRSPLGRAATERLIEEAVRAETGMALTPSPPQASGSVRVRRRVATTVARVMYLAWRSLQPGDGR